MKPMPQRIAPSAQPGASLESTPGKQLSGESEKGREEAGDPCREPRPLGLHARDEADPDDGEAEGGHAAIVAEKGVISRGGPLRLCVGPREREQWKRPRRGPAPAPPDSFASP